jgi:phosphoserine aminotransferase
MAESNGLPEVTAIGFATPLEWLAGGWRDLWRAPFSFLASVPSTRSCTSVCLVTDLTPPQLKAFLEVLDKEEVARDIASYRDAPAGIRIWCGPTVELSDLQALLPWLRWAHDECARL